MSSMSRNEAELEYAKWWLLQLIKKKSQEPGNQPLTVGIHWGRKGEPAAEWEKRALDALVIDKAIRAQNTTETSPVRVIGATFFDVWTLNDFDKTYELYCTEELDHELAVIDAARNDANDYSPVMPAAAAKFIAQLKRRFDAAIEATDDSNFFNALADYIKFINDHDDLTGLIFQSIVAESDADHEQFAKLREEVEQELVLTVERVQEILKNLPTDSPAVSVELSRLNAALFGEVAGRIHPLMNQYDAMAGFISQIGAQFPDQFTQLLAKDTFDKPYFQYSATYKKFMSEVERIAGRLARLTLWGAWNKLVGILRYAYLSEEYEKELSVKCDFMDIHSWAVTKGLFDSIVAGETVSASDRMDYFKRSDYELYLRKVHTRSIELLETVQDELLISAQHHALNIGTGDVPLTFVMVGLELFAKHPGGDIIIKKFRSKADGSYKSAFALVRAHGGALDRQQLGVRGSTKLKDVPPGIGFMGWARQRFIDYDSGSRTLTLPNPVVVTVDELAKIKSLSTPKVANPE